MVHVRLMTWCSRSVSGMHLPAFAASEGGLFAERGLEVEYVAAAATANAAEAVAAGDADFALTSAVHLLAAQTNAAGSLPIRFVANFHQYNPIAGVVREDSGRRTPQDLGGARAARWSIPWYAQEYAGALDRMGIAAPVIVETPGGLDQAIGSGEVEVLPMWMDDTTPAVINGLILHHAGESFGVRAIALPIPVYSTGLIAADRVPLEVVCLMREALAAGHDLQRDRPAPGLAGFQRWFPDVSEEHVRVNWSLYAPNAFDGGSPPGTMHAERWQDTIVHTARTHGVTALPGERVYRPELVATGDRRAVA